MATPNTDTPNTEGPTMTHTTTTGGADLIGLVEHSNELVEEGHLVESWRSDERRDIDNAAAVRLSYDDYQDYMAAKITDAETPGGRADLWQAGDDLGDAAADGD